MHKLATIAALWICTAPAWAADNKLDADARAKVIAPFLDDEAIAVGHVNLTGLDPVGAANKISAIGGVPEDLKLARMFLSHWVERLTKAGAKEVFFVVSMADLQMNTSPPIGFLIVPLEEAADAEALANVLGTVFKVGAKLPGHKAVFGGPKSTWERLQKLKPAARPEIAKAFAAAGDTAMQWLLVPTADNRRVIEEMMPQLPKELGGGSTKVITEGMLWAAIGIDLTPKMALRVVVQSKDGSSAKALQRFLEKAVARLASEVSVREALPDLAKVLAPLIPQVANDRLTAEPTEEQLAPALRQVLAQARGAAQRDIAINNLRNIGIAMHQYLDAHKVFPSHASFDNQGKPLLSWRVLILPYIDQSKLYKEFHLDEPWDSAHNKKLIARMPPIYHSANRKLTAAGKTRLLAPVGKDTMFPGNQPVKIRDVTDGTSNTILIVEALESRAVVWTKPDDLKIDPLKPRTGLVDKNKRFLVLFADASTRFLSATLDPKTLYALFTRNGGEVLGGY